MVCTDYSALQWLLDSKDPEGHMAWWIQELGTYDFVVPLKKHANVDGMSRGPCWQCGMGESMEIEKAVGWGDDDGGMAA